MSDDVNNYVEELQVFKGLGEALGIDNNFEQIERIEQTEETQNLPEVVSEEDSKELILSEDDAEAAKKAEEEKKFDEDFEASRSTLHDLTVRSQDIIEHYTEVAKLSESPVAYEALTKMMTMAAGFSKDLMNIHKIRTDIKESTTRDLRNQHKNPDQQEQDSTNMNIQNANILVGTTADMLKRLNENKE